MTITVRAVTTADLDKTAELDRRLTGQPRQDFHRKRLAAQTADPQAVIAVAAMSGDTLAGFAFAHVLDGEFGSTAPVAVLDTLGIAPENRGAGVGRALMAELDKAMRQRGVREVVTQADIGQRDLVSFFGAAGFTLAPRLVLERPTTGGLDFDTPIEPTSFGVEVNLSDPSGDEYAALSRDVVPVRSLTEGDLAAIVALDRRITGRDRTAFYRRKLTEVLTESGIRVSLVAELDGQFAGFVMARVGYGEFGRTEPVAALDTIGVNPAFAKRAVGRALVSQLLTNLGSLRVEKVQTEVAWNGFRLLRFLERCGFAPSQRLALRRRLD